MSRPKQIPELILERLYAEPAQATEVRLDREIATAGLESELATWRAFREQLAALEPVDVPPQVHARIMAAAGKSTSSWWRLLFSNSTLAALGAAAVAVVVVGMSRFEEPRHTVQEETPANVAQEETPANVAVSASISDDVTRDARELTPNFGRPAGGVLESDRADAGAVAPKGKKYPTRTGQSGYLDGAARKRTGVTLGSKMPAHSVTLAQPAPVEKKSRGKHYRYFDDSNSETEALNKVLEVRRKGNHSMSGGAVTLDKESQGIEMQQVAHCQKLLRGLANERTLKKKTDDSIKNDKVPGRDAFDESACRELLARHKDAGRGKSAGEIATGETNGTAGNSTKTKTKRKSDPRSAGKSN